MQLVIFDPRLGSEETAERKLLFYHPASTPLDQRVKTVGLAEAVTNLLSSFTAHDPEALHTQHGRQIFLQPEPNLWLVLLAPNQASPAVKPTAADASAKDKDSADLETLPAAEEALQDGTLMALLRRVYATLRMTCGPLSAIAEERGVDELRTLLGHVLPLLLKLVLSVVLEDPSRPDLLDMVEGMCFLPVDRRLYLRVHYLTNVLRSRHPCIQHVMVMHAEHLVWSSLTQAATQVLHAYLVSALTAPPPHPSRAERLQLNTASLPDEALAIGIALVQRQLRAFPRAVPAAGSFVCGAADSLQDQRSAVRVPRVYLEAQPGFEPSATEPTPTPSQPPPSAPPPPSSPSLPAAPPMPGTAPGTAPASASTTDGARDGAGASGKGGEGGAADGHSDGGAGPSGTASSQTATAGRGRPQPTERYRLVVFQLQQAVVSMLVDESAPQWQQPVWYQQLAALLVPELQPLAPLLAETQQRMTQLEEPYRFVYFNRHNLALKSSMRAAKAGAQRMGLGAEVKLLLDRVHTDVAGGGLSGGGRLKEVVLHAGPAGWIVGRGGGSRGLYVVLDGREYAWSEVLQEVQALMQSHFSNIFLDGT
jgi:hypothetical protein